MKNFHNSFKLLPALLLVTAGLWGHPTHAEQHEVSTGVELKEVDGAIEVLIDGELFTKVHYEGVQKPYLYPVVGPTGVGMTRSYPMVEGVKGESKDHPHHQSLWFAHGNINGVDYWHGGPQHGQTSVQAGPTIKGSSIALHADLIPGGNADLKQGVLKTQIAFSVAEDGSRYIDYNVEIPAEDRVKPFTFKDTKEGTMAIRLHPALRLKGPVAAGHCINSEGDADGTAWGKRAKWVAYWGEIDGETVGIAMFDHPTNLRHPTWWHARDYGLLAANPFGQHDFERGQPKGAGDYTIPEDEAFAQQYRVVFFEGTAEDAKIAEKYAAWADE